MCSSPYYLLYFNNILYVLRKKPTATHLEPQVSIIEMTLRSNLKETAVYCSVNYLFLLLDKGSAILFFCPKCNYDASINLHTYWMSVIPSHHPSCYKLQTKTSIFIFQYSSMTPVRLFLIFLDIVPFLGHLHDPKKTNYCLDQAITR